MAGADEVWKPITAPDPLADLTSPDADRVLREILDDNPLARLERQQALSQALVEREQARQLAVIQAAQEARERRQAALVAEALAARLTPVQQPAARIKPQPPSPRKKPPRLSNAEIKARLEAGESIAEIHRVTLTPKHVIQAVKWKHKIPDAPPGMKPRVS